MELGLNFNPSQEAMYPGSGDIQIVDSAWIADPDAPVTALKTDAPHHNPHYRMDEAALAYGVQYEYDVARALLDGTRRFWEDRA